MAVKKLVVGNLYWGEDAYRYIPVMLLKIYTPETTPCFNKLRILEVLYEKGITFTYPDLLHDIDDEIALKSVQKPTKLEE